MKILGIICLALGTVYGGYLAALYAAQDGMVFPTRPVDTARLAQIRAHVRGLEPMTVTAADGTVLRGYFLPRTKDARPAPALLYFCGNAEEQTAFFLWAPDALPGTTLAGDRGRLGLLAGDDLGADVLHFVHVAVGAAVAGLQEGAGAGVIAAGLDPFEGRRAGIEQADGLGRDRGPVDAVGGGTRGSCRGRRGRADGGRSGGRSRLGHLGLGGGDLRGGERLGGGGDLGLLGLGARGFLGLGAGDAVLVGLRDGAGILDERLLERLDLGVGETRADVQVGDALVAVDAGVAGFHGRHVALAGARLLVLGVHALEGVTVAAFAAVGCLHALPLVLGEGEALGVELLGRRDRAGELAPDLLRCLDLAQDLVGPVLRHVAIGADGRDAGAVRGVDGSLVFLEDGFAHLVTGDAELLGVRRFHGGVEAAPEQDAGDEAAADQRQDRVGDTGLAEDRPKRGRACEKAHGATRSMRESEEDEGVPRGGRWVPAPRRARRQ